MLIKPTRFRVWERKQKISGNGSEFADLFLSEKVTRKNSDKVTYNSIAAIAFGDVAKDLSQINKGDYIQVESAALNIEEYQDKATGKKIYKPKITIFDFEKVVYEK